ncbi:HRDC domain-containing protein [Desulfobotulus sp. H1]|uniref:HRDC domain-containing protein n=1 Tax=Desulfobotulus pelophilus TaxID=2823377 RepID=A0ABT3N5D0_9BACT|nr:ribonuclease D [Desulfobotulus pelophilus]MCW7752661.1 HRDC domain-containing protein [Desulfobotulus pelophilus]
MDSTYTLIETREALQEVLPLLKAADRVGVDLEADSMFHFKEKVCLIQLAIDTGNFVLDPLSIGDLSCLGPVFANPGICKVFHGADYDVRSLFRDFGFTVENLWDTELATRFLGCRASGLNAVLKERFGVCLDKKYQKKDWSQRPLSPEMIAYAAEDTRYLLALSRELESELAARGRLEWVAEECHLLQQVRAQEGEERPLFLRFKGAGRLDRRSLAVLESFLEFRMEIAEKKDKPLFKVLGGEPLLRLAQLRPRTMEAMRDTNSLSPRQLSMFGSSLLDCIHGAMAIPDASLPVYPRSKALRIKPQVALRIKVMKEWRDRLAEELSLDPALLCNKSLLTKLAQCRPTSMEELSKIGDMRKWQRELLGEGLLRVLEEPGLF